MHPTPADLVAWDHAHLWHPFTQMQEWLDAEPLVIARGEGNWLVDIRGRRYLDGVSSLWCNVHGHRRPELDAALREQIDRVAHSTLLGLTCEPAVALAKRLVDITPARLSRVFYSDAGATAVEIALKMAFQYWQLCGHSERTRFAALTESYHGDTIGAVSVGYSEAFHRFFKPLVFPCHKLNPPHVHRWELGLDADTALRKSITEAEQLFDAYGRELAALIVEPLMQGAAGMWAHPVAYLTALRDLARESGTLLICDEVATGFARTGRMFAVEHAQVEPDLMCIGKGLTGGYLPLAATFASEQIFAAFLGAYDEFKAFFHGHTYTGNALGCAVALANLDIFEHDRVVDGLAPRIEQLTRRLARDFAPLVHVGDVRQWGLMVGIELVRDRGGRVPYAPGERMGVRVITKTREHGVIIRPLGNVIVLMPPLSITADELDLLCDVTRDAIISATDEGGA